MNTSRLKRFAQIARTHLLEGVRNRYLYWGFADDGSVVHRVEKTTGGYLFRESVFDDSTIPTKWENLRQAIQRHTGKDLIEEAAYSWFNRLLVIKILEENGYDPPVLGYVSDQLKDPVILQNARSGIAPQMSDQDQHHLKELLMNSDDEGALSLLLISYCRNHPLLKHIFGTLDDYTELLLPGNLLSSGGIIELINSDEYITDEDFRQVELIGWLYQFYISDKKDEVFESFRKKKKARAEDIPAATQIFTPQWIVKYLVENTVGRIWLDKHPDSPIRESMRYLVEPADENQTCSEPIIADVTELKVLDPAVGSGHFLVVAFDLLMRMYLEEGYSRRHAVESIIRNNLFGLDICKRAAQLANFAILLKAASYDPDVLTRNIIPQI